MNKTTSFIGLSEKTSIKKYSASLFLCASVLSLWATGISTVQAEEENVEAANPIVEQVSSTEVASTMATSESATASSPEVSEEKLPQEAAVLAAAEPVSESSQVMSDAEKQRAIAQMGSNQGDVWVWSSENVVPDEKRGPNGGPGQFNAGSVVLGGRPTFDPAADWYYLAYKKDEMTDEEALADFNKERGKWMDEFDPWGVVLEMSDNKAANAWADVRNMQAFVLRQGSNVWDKIMDHPEAVDWAAQFKGNMSSYVEDARQESVAGGGTSLEVLPKQDRVAHWGSNQVRNIQNPQTIRAVLVSVEARISEKSDPDAKLGIQVGGDWKFTNETIHPAWYPGAGLAGIQRLTKDWARYYFVSVAGVQDAMPERAISQAEFLASIVPLADMTTNSENQALTTPDNSGANKNAVLQQASDLSTSADPLAAQGVTKESTPAAQQVSPGQTRTGRLPSTGTRKIHPLAHFVSLLLLGLSFGLLRRKKEK